MKKQIGKLLARLKSGQRARANSPRRLRMESLEGRRLLAADIAANHNYLIAEDVNLDFNVSPLDALLVINALNQGGSRGFAEGEVSSGVASMLDVNGDNYLSPIDALLIVNRLNAEGEDPTPQNTFIRFSYQVTDTAGAPISNTVVVGSTFRINVLVQDVRPASARTITDPTDPDYARFNGIFSAAQDLGISNLNLVNFVRPTSFFSGVRFSDDFFNDRGVIQGGGIQIGGDRTPSVSDGQTFILTSSLGSATFEYDIAGTTAVAAGNIPVPLRNTASTTPVISLSFDEVGAALVTAIQGAGLGLSPVYRGDGVLGLPTDSFTLNPVNSGLLLSGTELEYLNEVRAFLDGTRSRSPDDPTLFYSASFQALASGSVIFTPNGPERPGSENTFLGSTVAVPNSMVAFGAPIAITIVSDPSAPVAVTDTISTPEDTAIVLGANVTGNDTVTAGRTLTVNTVTTIPGVTVGSVSGTTYTPPAQFFGTDRVVYTVRDSSGLVSGSATVTINVTSVNDAPNAFNDLFGVDEDSSGNILAVLADNGSGADNAGPSNETSDTINITSVGTVSGVGTPFTTPSGGTVSISVGSQTLTYTPAPTFVGTDSFAYTITDSGGLTATATVTVEVAPGVLPRARRDTGTGAENTSVSIDVLANDSLNPGATASIISFVNGARGTVARSGANPNILIYTPTDPNFYGTDTFTYVMNDSSGLGVDSIGTVVVTITDVNDVPELVGDTATTNEDTPLTIPFATLLANDSPGAGETVNTPAQTLTIISVAAVTTGGGSVAISGSNVVYTPAADFNGTFLFTYTAQDSGVPALSSTATVTVSVAAVNDNPIANADTVSGTEDTTLLIPAGNTTIVAGNVLFNDTPGPATATDEASQILTVTGVGATSASGGTVSLVAGVISYVPPANFNGVDTLTYSISDGAGGTATGTVTINVAAVNDPPIAGADSVSGFRDIPITIPVATLLANDSPGGGPDEVGQTLSITEVISTASTNGSVVLNGNGTITYTPSSGFTGAASFQYTLRDSGGETAVGTVNVSIAEFVPSTIQGTVWEDSDGDNGIDPTERRLGGVVVTLSGTTAQGQSVPARTLITLADGGYSFRGLGPGTYTVSYATPRFLYDAPGPNFYQYAISNPAGTTISDQNFAVMGGVNLTQVENSHTYQQVISQFASSRIPITPVSTAASDIQNVQGGYFAIGKDNTSIWSALPRTTSTTFVPNTTVAFAELVLAGSGSDLKAYLSVVDAITHTITTRTLSYANRDFFTVPDQAGNLLVGILKVPTASQVVNRATPPISVNKFLDSVDAVFAQEGWL